MASDQVQIIEGRLAFNYPTLPKPCETWYKIYGDLKSSKRGRPIVMLHGGPGACHNYLLPLADLATKHGIPVIFYDQIGCGKSTRLREKRLDHEFWAVDMFMSEFDNLVQHLGISDSFDVLGQSWGGMLLGSIAVRGHPGLNRIVIANSPASIDLWLKGCDHWKSQLPKDVEETVLQHERDQTYDSPDYKKAVQFFYERYMCRVVPFPKDVQDTMDLMEEDDTVYFTMNGPSEFTVIGNLKTFDLTPHISKITVPALIINAEYDPAIDEAVKPWIDGIKEVKWHKFLGCSHMSHVEKTNETVELILNFLTG